MLNSTEQQPNDATESQKEHQFTKTGSHGSSNGPTASSPDPSNTTNNSTPSKPVLIRQDRTYLASPQLSATGGSEESTGGADGDEDLQLNARSAPDLELNCRVETPKISISNSCMGEEHSHSMQLVPSNRCRQCSRLGRRSSTTPSSMQMHRSFSKESVRSALPGHLSPNTNSLMTHQHHSTTIPPVLVTSSPTARDRIIRQSSQPEQACCPYLHHQSSSLRQLKEPSDPISDIATETLRISGVIRPFKQVSPFFI